jgi:hypothetical protein
MEGVSLREEDRLMEPDSVNVYVALPDAVTLCDADSLTLWLLDQDTLTLGL